MQYWVVRIIGSLEAHGVSLKKWEKIFCNAKIRVYETVYVVMFKVQAKIYPVLAKNTKNYLFVQNMFTPKIYLKGKVDIRSIFLCRNIVHGKYFVSLSEQ